MLALKLKIQQYCPLRPEAWLAIQQCLKTSSLKSGQYFVRQAYNIAYISNGLLKEYNSHLRIHPSIVNFLMQNDTILTREINEKHYFKSILPTKIYYLTEPDLTLLAQQFKELIPAYKACSAQYDNGIELRMYLLEQKSFADKVKLFKKTYAPIIPFLKKKDIANYFNVNYCYFLHHWHQHI